MDHTCSEKEVLQNISGRNHLENNDHIVATVLCGNIHINRKNALKQCMVHCRTWQLRWAYLRPTAL
jgi:hypothetical protein